MLSNVQRRRGTRMFRRYHVSLVLLAGLLFLAAQSTALAQDAGFAGKYRELQGRLAQYKDVPQADQAAVAGAAGGHAPLAQTSSGPGGYLRSLSAPCGYNFLVSSPVKGDPTATAKGFLAEYGVLFGIKSKSVDFASMRIGSRDGRRYVHLQQKFGGIPVFAGEMVVQVSEADGIECVMSGIGTRTDDLDSGSISLNPTISTSDAQQAALELVAGGRPGMSLSASTPALRVYDPQVVGNKGAVRLAWETVVSSTGAPIVEELVLLDAHKGSLLLRYSLIEDAMNRRIYDSANTSGDGALVRSEGGPATGIADADAAYDFLGDTYTFYFNEHSRDSIDGAGMSLIAHVRYGPMENAFWDPYTQSFYFGAGFAADDVVAHEYTHGITDHESGLIYLNQSGAINEAFSDAWGEFVDLTNGRGNDSPAVRWLMGEDTSIGVIRSMKDPPAYGLPDRMGSPLWYSGPDDNGGVHTNMGVGSKLVYLITDGGAFNGYTISGMGIGRVADLLYEAQTNLLTKSAGYGDLYSALAQAALNLAWNAGDQANLRNACRAVEMDNDGFARRTVIDAGGGTVRGSNAGATKEPSEPNHAGNTGGSSVWWTWTPAVSGSAQIDTIGSGFDTLLGVYTGNSVSTLVTVASDDNGGGDLASMVTFSVVAGTTYQIAVDGYDGASGGIVLHVIAPPIANDSFANRIAVNAGGDTVTGTNVGTTKEAGEPNHAGNSGGRSVWWTWTPTISGSAQIDTGGSDFDTLLGVYTGDSVSALTTVASDDDGNWDGTSLVTLSVVAGTAYQIAVDGYDGASGSVTLHVIAPIANDNFSDRTVISAAGGTVMGANVGATKEAGEPNHAGSSGGSSVWWTWTPLGSGSVQIDTIGSSFDTLLGVYTGSSVSSLTTVASDDDGGGGFTSKVTFNAVAGRTYQIAVDGYGGASGSIALHIIISAGPTYQAAANDPESSTTSTGYVPKVALTFAPPTMDDWIIFGFCEFKCPNVNYATFVQLFIDNVGAGQNTRKPVDPTDYLPFICVKVANLSPGSHTIALRYRAGDPSAAAYIRNARICAVRKAALEFYNAAYDNARPLSITLQDIATLTWTPATIGNYLVISTAEINATTAVSTDLQTIYNGVINDEGIMRASDDGDYTTFMSFNYCANTPAGVPITHKIAGRKMAASTTNHYIRRARILALRLSQSRFNNTAAGSSTEQATALTAFQQALSTTWTYGVSGKWLFLNSARVLNTLTSCQTEVRVQLNDTTTCAQQLMKPKHATDLLNFSSIDVRNLTTPRRVDMDYRTTNAAGTAKVRRNRFYGLPLDAQ
jgi:Zn-dependent metalloprotease